jgi:uncharacterized protein (TIGR03067 family)
MRRSFLASLGAFALLSFPVRPTAADDSKEFDALKGHWTITKFEVDDRDEPFLVSFRVEVIGKSFFFKPPQGEKVELTMKLDPSTSPKCIDLTIAKDKQLIEGIYTIEEGVWKLCVAAPNRNIKARPSEFTSKDSFILLTLKRSDP